MRLSILTDDLAKANDHFIVTAMTGTGLVHKINVGKFGARKVTFPDGTIGCLKPKNHSTELYRGIPRSAQHLHEVAAYQLDHQILHFDIVPTTVLTIYKGQQASLCEWVEGRLARDIVPGVFDRKLDDWKEKVALFSARVNVAKLRSMVLFDLIVNNTDRHAKNCMFAKLGQRVWAIDNGLAFGKAYRYYFNVFHRAIFRTSLKLADDERVLLRGITQGRLETVLGRYLTPREVTETYWRIQWVLAQPDLGFKAISEGRDAKNEFPDRADWFKRQMAEDPKNKMLSKIEGMGIYTAV